MCRPARRIAIITLNFYSANSAARLNNNNRRASPWQHHDPRTSCPRSSSTQGKGRFRCLVCNGAAAVIRKISHLRRRNWHCQSDGGCDHRSDAAAPGCRQIFNVSRARSHANRDAHAVACACQQTCLPATHNLISFSLRAGISTDIVGLPVTLVNSMPVINNARCYMCVHVNYLKNIVLAF